MKLLKNVAFILLTFLLSNSCRQKKAADYSQKINSPAIYHAAVNRLTDVIIHDIFTPPVASRIYSYATLAGYEAMVLSDENYPSMVGKIKDFTSVPKPEINKE